MDKNMLKYIEKKKRKERKEKKEKRYWKYYKRNGRPSASNPHASHLAST